MCEPSVGIVGCGRLGSAVIRACGRHVIPIALTASRRRGWKGDAVPTVLVDASGPGAQDRVREYCLLHRIPLVECVSDLDADQWRCIADLARHVPVVRATNLTVGHYLQTLLVDCATSLQQTPAPTHPEPPAPTHAPPSPPSHAQALAPETSIWERHPVTKAHRPSATARELAAATGIAAAEISVRRAGPPVSEHEVMWTWAAETLVLRHSVGSVDAAGEGAVAAVRWAMGRQPGLVSMRTVYDDLIRPIGDKHAADRSLDHV